MMLKSGKLIMTVTKFIDDAVKRVTFQEVILRTKIVSCVSRQSDRI